MNLHFITYFLQTTMFGKKKSAPQPPRERKRTNLAQLGLMDVESIEDDNDEDLEAELNKIMGVDPAVRKSKKAVPEKDLESMVAACMKDDYSDDDEDLNDPDLLNELAGLDDDDERPAGAAAVACHASHCPGEGLLSTINERISMYSSAEKRAKEAGETSRARRYARGLATLTDLKRKVNSGKPVSDEDIPPAISVPSPMQPPSQPLPVAPSEPAPPPVAPREPVKPPVAPREPAPPPVVPKDPAPPPPILQPIGADPEPVKSQETTQIDPVTAKLKAEREKYKDFALKAKASGNKDHAVFGLKAVKLCDTLMAKSSAGEPVGDLSTLLPPLPTTASPPKLQRTFSRDDPIQLPEDPADIPPPDPSTFGAPPPPLSILEALNQRLER